MSRINSNIPSLIAQRIFTTQNERLNTSLHRLSTGLRINSGKDDPAGLIASETLRAEMRAIQAAQTNIARASNVVAVTESGLNEINSLLNDLEDLVDRSSNKSGISDEERVANQLEIDGILASINRIAGSTELQGRKLLNGELAYNTSSVVTTNIAHLNLNSVTLTRGQNRPVSIKVTTAASYAAVSYTGGAMGINPVTIEVTGNLGTERLTLASASIANIASAITQTKQLTGVSGAVVGTDVRLASVGYGSANFVRVRVLSGTFNVAGNKYEDTGTDVRAVVNGQSVGGLGVSLMLRTPLIDSDITLTKTFAGTVNNTTNFYVTGGGAKFMISPSLEGNSETTVGVDSVRTSMLGDRNLGYLYTLGTGEANQLSSDNFNAAQQIVRKAIDQVSSIRGRLGSFEKNTLETTLNSLRVQYENVAAAESVLRDTDFAQETSMLTRQQILVQSSNMVLRLANQSPQNILSLLGG